LSTPAPKKEEHPGVGAWACVVAGTIFTNAVFHLGWIAGALGWVVIVYAFVKTKQEMNEAALSKSGGEINAEGDAASKNAAVESENRASTADATTSVQIEMPFDQKEPAQLEIALEPAVEETSATQVDKNQPHSPSGVAEDSTVAMTAAVSSAGSVGRGFALVSSLIVIAFLYSVVSVPSSGTSRQRSARKGRRL
jgi:cytoskeletal protein RodZ